VGAAVSTRSSRPPHARRLERDQDALALPFAAFSKFSLVLPLWFYVPFAVFVVVATSNAVNLTDGLDGLAIGPVMINAGTYLIWAYVAGATIANCSLADVPRHPEDRFGRRAQRLLRVRHRAGIGFLWYNTYPAQVFMGDVGALALGGGLGMLAMFTKNEVLSHPARRHLLHRDPQRHHAGRELQAHGQAHLPHGADPPPLREEGVGRAQDHRALLDHLDPAGARLARLDEAQVMA
jgi:hypothetical protein